MKKIEAVIRPFKLDIVKNRLSELGIKGMMVCEIKGFGRQKGHREIYRGSEYQAEFVPKLLLTLVVEDSTADEVTQTILKHAGTGSIGDGKIFISDIAQVYRIRTKETGKNAI